MSSHIEMILERRGLLKSRGRWRIAAILITALLVVGLIGYLSGSSLPGVDSPHIARLSITNVITEDRRKLDLIETLAKDDNVKAVLVSINSPGGTTAGGEAIYEALRALSDKKPIVAHIGTIGTSAGYMAALASDHIVARRTALTGSIGVLFQFGNAGTLLDTIGIKMETIKSSPLKGEPTPFAPVGEDVKDVLRDVIDDTYQWFVSLVVERRKLSPDAAKLLADGRIYTGAQAKEKKLIDAIGGESLALTWLNEKHEIDTDLVLIDRQVKIRERLSLLDLVGYVLGIEISGNIVEKLLQNTVVERLRLDGLVSIWHGSFSAEE